KPVVSSPIIPQIFWRPCWNRLVGKEPEVSQMVRRLLIIGAGMLSVCTLSGLLPTRGQAAAQQKPLMAEAVFKNVQVLKGIPVNQFMETMGFFSAALGYNCTNCHGDEVLGNWQKYADDIPVKSTARRMIQVVNTINKDLFGGSEAVTCYTCDRCT